MVDGSIIGDINELVLQDRERLSQDGAIVIACFVDLETRKIVSDIAVETKGFMMEEQVEEIMDDLVIYVRKLILQFLKTSRIDLDNFHEEFKKDMKKYLQKNTDKMPIVIPGIIDIREKE